MPITYQRSSFISAVGAGFGILETSASPVDGDVRVVIAEVSSTVTVTAPAGWTVVLNDNTFGSSRVFIAYKVFATGSGQENFTYSASANQITTIINLGNQPDVSGTTWVTANNGGTSGTSFVAPSLVPSTADGLLITTFQEAVSGGALNATFTTPAGMSSMGQKVPTGTQSRTSLSTYLATTTTAATGTKTSTGNTAGTSGWNGTSLFVPSIASSTPISTTDAATVTDTSSVFVTDSTTDSAAVSSTSSVSDSTPTSDTSTVSETSLIGPQTSDSITATDTSSLAKFDFLSTSDSITATDAVVLPINTSQQEVGSESASVTESSSVSATSSTSESITATDSSSVSVTQSRTESGTVSEASQINQSRTEQISATEQSQIGETKSESASVSESATVGQSLTDSISVTETSQLEIITGDSISVEEDSSTYATITDDDSIAFQEQAGAGKPTFGEDSFTVFEKADVFVVPQQTEDVIVYREQDTQNKSFRVIAQDHFTREFIHWDLPLDGLQVTYALNGPNLLVGTISSEMESIMSLDPPLVPDRTWLHLEEDGVIRGSFLLTPFVDSPATQSRQIEAEGFSVYPNWIVYEGDAFVGVQVDPADMIRSLWDHVQSYPDGDLNVQISPTKTPVKIGDPPEAVNFTTSDGNQVSFQSGPYTLNYWAVTNCGSEIDKLCQETPIDYQEFSKWNDNKTDVEHTVVLGYPRLGTKRTDLGFREGENLSMLIPSYQGSNDNYASDVIVIGAGTGPSAVRAIHSGRIGLLRKTNVIQNQDITNHSRAQALADFEFKRIAHSRFLIESITVDCTNENSLWGSFQTGDDILVEATVDYVGYIQDWYRITSYVYDPYQKIASINLSPSDSFTYGAENVDPFDELPTSGYAQLGQTQDFSSLVTQDESTIDPTSLLQQKQNFVQQSAQQMLCTYFNANGLDNGFCYYWYFVSATPVTIPGLSIQLPTYAAAKGPLSDLSVTKNNMVIGKTDYGHILTGDNIQLISSDGTVGQIQNTTSEITYPSPFYPIPNDVGTVFGLFEITDTDQSTYQQQVIFAARQDGLRQFVANDLSLGQALFIRTATDGGMSLLLGTLASMGSTDILVIERDNSGTVQVGAGIQINSVTRSLTGLQQAAQAILDQINSGNQFDAESWTWLGMPDIAAQYSDILIEKFYGYHNISTVQFLSAVISGQIT